ncbi:MAG TPA: ethylbenzene dehydrogenase-related protein [Candidatus Binatia bacterium]|nr:ethylbenzene dehydrogenase-related protein [Candidatus Binatia bacterium]
MQHKSLGGIAVAILSVLFVSDPARGASTSSAEVVAVRATQVPTTPDDAAWENAPVFAAALVQQDMVEPRLLQPSTDKVDLRALTDGKRIVFRLEWADSTKNDLPGLGKFSDACAVQLPVSTGPDVPAPQMGESQRPVEITYWRAFWQSTVDGRDDSINALFPNATVDHYPFEAASLETGSPAQQAMAKRYAPARALDNNMAGPRDRPVQDLIAEGPGTIAPAPKQLSDGRGVRTQTGWRVMLSRPVPAGLEPGQRTQVAVAVWEGAHQEGGSRKMRSPWVPLLLQK